MICPTCTLVQVTPQPDADVLTEYYSSGAYREEFGGADIVIQQPGQPVSVVDAGSEDYGEALDMLAEVQAKRLLDAVKPPAGATVLEVGCGEGRMLAVLAPRYEGRIPPERWFRAAGIEPDKSTDVYDDGFSRGTMAHVHRGTMETATDSDSGWRWLGGHDLVTAHHVLEHQADPIAFVRQMASFAKPGGTVYVEVPDVLHPASPDLDDHWQWVHLFDLSRHTLCGLLVCAGLDRVCWNEDGSGNLYAWGTWNGHAQRPYAPHKGATVAEVIEHLDDHRARQATRVNAGKAAARGDVAALIASVGPLRTAWSGTQARLRALSNRWAEQSEAVLTDDADPFALGLGQGQSKAYIEAHRELALVVALGRKAQEAG